MSPYAELLVPEGTRLLHIGPHKTGSTAIQVSLHRARAELAAHGVYYAGGATRPKQAGWAIGLMGRPAGSEVPPLHHWETLVEEVASASAQRVCISNEDFGRADREQRRRIVADLGGGRPHVVAVARRLDRYLPSQWQERVKAGDTRAYDEWLKAVLEESPEPTWDRTNVWRAHDTARLIRNWVEVVGEENVTLIVGDESDRMQLLHAFEGLLGLPVGTLESHPDKSNRGLSWGEVELVREINLACEERGWSREDRNAFMKRGVIKALTSSADVAPGPRTPPMPAWAADVVRRLSEAAVAAVAATGVRVVGDPAHLRVPDDLAGSDTEPDLPAVSPRIAATAVMGGVARTREAGRARPQPATRQDDGLVAGVARTARRVRARFTR